MDEPLATVREELASLLPRLRRFARALTGDPHDADDVVQVALERALARIGQWRPDQGQGLAPWVYGIVRNAWIDEQRARARRQRLFAAEAAGAAVGDPAAQTPAALLSLQAALARLPQEQREAVALVLVEGLSYREAAETLAIPVGTLTSRLARGREALQAWLDDDGTGA